MNHQSIIYVGDLHGHFAHLINFVRQSIESSSIIQVGDFGLGFNPSTDYATLFNINKAMVDKNCVLYAIRGNHDDPKYWNDSQYSFSNIVLVKDLSVLNIQGIYHLFIGGAISIDRRQRIPGQTWWPDESMPINQLQHIDENQYIDVVVTHNAPDFCYPQTLNSLVRQYMVFDSNLESELKLERAALTALYNRMKIKPKKWFYGHFHEDHTDNFDSTIFKLLNADEFYEYTYEIEIPPNTKKY